ncbi:MAG: PDZ domain-containing protein [bacterium]|nr:PDZ domain-containing protein [bacterium]
MKDRLFIGISFFFLLLLSNLSESIEVIERKNGCVTVRVTEDDVKNQRYNLNIIDSDGKNLRTIFSSRYYIPSFPWWIDDNRIVFSWIKEKKGFSLGIIDINNGNLEELVTKDSIITDVIPSPDGKRIAFICSNNLFLFNLNDINLKRLINLKDNFKDGHMVTNLTWCPDGKRLVFVVRSFETVPSKDNIWLFDINKNRIEQLTLGNNTLCKDGNSPLSFSPEGNKVVFSNKRERSCMLIVNIDNKEIEGLRFTKISSSITDPIFMPDGKKIIFSGVKKGGRTRNIWEANLERKDSRQLTFFEEENNGLIGISPSPDGKRVVFSEITHGGRNLWVMNADGNGLRKLGESFSNDPSYLYTTYMTPAWSKDGSKIAFVTQHEVKPKKEINRGGYLGIVVQDLTEALARQFDVKNGKGIFILEVRRGSPAEKAGLRRGDIIKKINRKEIHSVTEFQKEVRRKTAGESIVLLVIREGQKMSISATLEEMP